MALPHRRQAFAKYLKFYDIDHDTAASALGTNRARIRNLCWGQTYPRADEIEAILRLFGGSLPIEIYFDPEMLVYRDHVGPIPRGGNARAADLERALAQMDRDRHEAGE